MHTRLYSFSLVSLVSLATSVEEIRKQHFRKRSNRWPNVPPDNSIQTDSAIVKPWWVDRNAPRTDREG